MIRVIVGAILTLTVLGVSDVQATCTGYRSVVYKIAKREGFNKLNSLPQRQNNPCSLIFTGQRGAVKGKRGFATFMTLNDGFEACEMDVSRKLRAGIKLHKGWKYL